MGGGRCLTCCVCTFIEFDNSVESYASRDDGENAEADDTKENYLLLQGYLERHWCWR